MTKIAIKTKNKAYPVLITENFKGLKNCLKDAKFTNKKILIITDTNVEKLYLDEVLAIAKGVSNEEEFGGVFVFAFEAGEESKTLETVQSAYKIMAENKFDRESAIIALGGGVVGDLAGFVASSYMRGISFCQVPTTLLSQVDSSVGGKVAVDFMGKNMVGAFYQPEFVYINIKTLNTLDKTQFSSGMGEVIKHSIIADMKYFDFLEENRERIKAFESGTIKKLIATSVKIKASIVRVDEKEKGIRANLNLGHTFGHAIEVLSDYTILHGEAVAIGMNAALSISAFEGNIRGSEKERALEIMDFFELPIKTDKFLPEQIYEKMLIDKKNSDGKINLVLIEKMGKAYVLKGASKELVNKGISAIVSDLPLSKIVQE